MLCDHIYRSFEWRCGIVGALLIEKTQKWSVVRLSQFCLLVQYWSVLNEDMLSHILYLSIPASLAPGTRRALHFSDFCP